MIATIRAAILEPQVYCSHLKSAFFHSTPILQRKHQSNSKARSKRLGRKRTKLNFRRNVNDFAQHLFGIWSDGSDYSGKHTSCFEKQHSSVSKRNRNGRHIPHNFDKRCFEEEFDIDYILRTSLVHLHMKGGNLEGVPRTFLGQTTMKKVNLALKQI